MESLNPITQPADQHPLFNNWQVVPEAWYFARRSSELKVGQIASLQILKQKIVIYRDQDGECHALDSFCPHMGMDLALGKVSGKNLRCFFHHWEYGGDGRCRKIPALGRELPASGSDMGLNSYPVSEKYGLIWIYAGRTPRVPVLEVPGLEGKDIIFKLGRINRNQSHHHISMINGLDPQHLITVHGLSIEMEIQAQESSAQIEFVLSGDVPKKTRADRWMRWWIGPRYSYSMKYSQASIASLTLFRDVYFRRRDRPWPRLHMLYAYRPLHEGLCETQPIYVAERTPGHFGTLRAKFLIWLTKRAYFFLKDDDDKVYDHIRFDARRLLPIDAPIKQYITFVNRLTPSLWTRKEKNACTVHKVGTEFTADL